MVALAPFATRYAPSGMVAAVDHLAAGAGVAMLREGGSAADAAIAANAVLAVTCQHMCGMGGDLFALVHEPSNAEPFVLNASGRAGSGADPNRLRGEGHTRMPFRLDIRSVPMPGCVDGWVALHQRFGRLPLTDVLDPAIVYAKDGFTATPSLAASAATVADLPGADDYRAAGKISPGATIRRPSVARALEAIAKGGREAFYDGEFGEGLVQLGRGEYSEADLREAQFDWVQPLGLDVWGQRLWTVPPNSQGYLTLASAWIAEGLTLPEDPDDPSWAHLLVEASRAAAHDRPNVLHEHADGAALLDPQLLAARRAAIDPRRAAELGAPAAAGDTTYLCAVDGDRMGISLIQSNAAGFGSGLVEPRTRIFLQNRGVGFSLEPGHPAEYGPGRRPPHTLSPALVTRDGALSAVIGTEGGDGQPQILLQLLARLLHHGQGPGDAMAAGRWVLGPVEPGQGFDTWDAAGRVAVRLERHAPSSWAEGLRGMGHLIGEEGRAGFANVIRVEGDHLAGASDPRALSGAAFGL